MWKKKRTRCTTEAKSVGFGSVEISEWVSEASSSDEHSSLRMHICASLFFCSLLFTFRLKRKFSFARLTVCTKSTQIHSVLVGSIHFDSYLLLPSIAACFRLAMSRLHSLRSYGRPYGLKCVLSVFPNICSTWEEDFSKWTQMGNTHKHCAIEWTSDRRKKCGAKNAKLDFQSEFLLNNVCLNFPCALILRFQLCVTCSFSW